MLITPLEFMRAWIRALPSFEQRLLASWESPAARYTSLWRDRETGIIRELASGLGLDHCVEYWTIDGVMFRERDTGHFPGGSSYAKRVAVALEHENSWRDSCQEMNKLCQLNAPLSVLVTYPKRRSAEGLLKKFSDIARAADFFEDFASKRRKLVVFGFRIRGAIDWEFHLFDGKEFEAASLGPALGTQV